MLTLPKMKVICFLKMLIIKNTLTQYALIQLETKDLKMTNKLIKIMKRTLGIWKYLFTTT